MDYTKFNARSAQTVSLDVGLRAYMVAVFNYMAAALALTGAVAYGASTSDAFLSAMFSVNAAGHPIGMSVLGWVISLSPLAFIFIFNSKINSVSTQTAKILFGAFAILMGLSLTSIFLVYTHESIVRVFFITASVFGAMSLYGYTTKKDLTSFGSFLMMGLMGVIMASLVNMFLKSAGLDFALSLVGVLIFTGLTAYDVQKLKSIYIYNSNSQGMDVTKLAIMGALNLYMDFINLFVYLLRFLGNRRSD